MKSPLEKTGAWKHASMLWLTANVVGTVLLGLWLLTKGDSNFVVAPIIGFLLQGFLFPSFRYQFRFSTGFYSYPINKNDFTLLS